MGRFCNGLMTGFRVIQLLLSIVTLGCGGFITYKLLDLSNAAHQVELGIESLLNQANRTAIEHTSGTELSDDIALGFIEVLDTVLKPILQFMQGVPIRAIVVTAVSLWSIIIIIYLFIAQRSTTTSSIGGRPRMNKRSVRITLEVITLILWLVGITSAVMLALEFSVVALAGGTETKVAFSFVKDLLKTALETLFSKSDQDFQPELTIVDDLMTIGSLSIITAVAACISGVISIVSLLAACCISGKQKTKKIDNNSIESGVGAAEYLIPSSAEKDKKKSEGLVVSAVPIPASWQSQYSPLPYSAYSPGRGYRGQ